MGNLAILSEQLVYLVVLNMLIGKMQLEENMSETETSDGNSELTQNYNYIPTNLYTLRHVK